MQVSVSNDVKIYNLSAGKSLPEWITDRKRRKLEQKDVEIRRRVQLVQDLEMPSVSRTVDVSSDGRYLFTTGSYKPMVKCYDLNELSLKFERGVDAEVIKMLLLSEDYSKFVLLEEERFVEFHTGYGRFYRLRIPNFGRDISFCREISELYITGCQSQIFRLNLEQGIFLEPLTSSAQSLTCCQFNDDHQLLVSGTSDGRVEAWDYRDKNLVSTLDCTLNNAIALELDFDSASIPEVTSLKFKDALHLGVGLSTGHVLLYDIRSSKPQLIKNHQLGLPIKNLDFVKDQELVLSMDSRALKIWHERDGRPFSTIEPGKDLNDFVRYKNSGLLFFANDDPKLQQFFVPSLGPAPKWCAHLESITEELEETEQLNVYDDFKFLTKAQIDDLQLSNLIGTSAVRAYMHGYFIDMNAYKKAKEASQATAFETYRRKRLQKKLEEERQVSFLRGDRKKLPKVNRELASRLQMELSLSEARNSKAATASSNILGDERFAGLFENADYEIDPESEQFQQLEPLMRKLGTKRMKLAEAEENYEEENEEA